MECFTKRSFGVKALCIEKGNSVLAEGMLCAEEWGCKNILYICNESLHMCWREGVVDEVRMMKSSERLRVWLLSFQKWSTIKRFLNERELAILPF